MEPPCRIPTPHRGAVPACLERLHTVLEESCWPKPASVEDLEPTKEAFEELGVQADDDGLTITGTGRKLASQAGAWIAIIPEIPSLLLLALSGLAVMRRR